MYVSMHVSMYVYALRGRDRRREGEEEASRVSHMWLNFNQNTH